MSSMTYCRFQNTLKDLRDCETTLDEIGGELDELSDEEAIAARRLINCCKRIVNDFLYTLEDEKP